MEKSVRLHHIHPPEATLSSCLEDGGTMGNTPLSRNEFGKDFLWGTSTAAYQIEGAAQLHGKGLSIWDTFTKLPKKIKDGSSGEEACNFYRNYPEDISMVRQLNLEAFRFSLSWARLFPNGTGAVNKRGVDFYHRLIDHCLSLGIQPWVTLYHWDLPQALEHRGGWVNRAIVDWFSEYVDFATRTYGDKIKHWMVLNEPTVFTAAGYFVGSHAPGRKGFSNLLPAAHHAALCQAAGGRIARRNVSDAQIGTTFSFSHIDPYKPRKRDIRAAQRLDALFNRFFLEASLGLGYPYGTVPGLKQIEKYFQAGDDAKLAFEFDFIGVQNYTREVARFSLFNPLVWAKHIPADKRGVETTEMKWEIYPESIYHILKKVSAYPGIKKIYVTENGAAFPDKVTQGRVADSQRTQFFRDYLNQVLRAKKEGVQVNGYFVWTLMDNFEWAEGYQPRFGLVYVDFKTQQRIIKDSGYWFREFLKIKA